MDRIDDARGGGACDGPRWSRESRIGLLAGLAAPGLVLAILLWVCSALPMQDLPEHVQMASVIAHGVPSLGDGGPAYSVSLSPSTYVGTFWAWRVLSIFLAPEAGGRLLVILYCIGCAAAAAALLRRLRPDLPLVAALAVGWWVPFSFFYYMGFLPYLFAVPFVLLLMFHLVGLVERPESGRPMAAVAVNLVVLYLMHPLGVAVGALAVLLLPVIGRTRRPYDLGAAGAESDGSSQPPSPSPNRVWWRRWVPALVIAAALLGVAALQTADSVRSSVRSLTVSVRSGNPYTTDNWMDTLELAARVPAGPLHGAARTVEWSALGLLGAAAAWSLARRSGRPARGGGRSYARWILVMAASILGASYVMASLQPTGTVYHRLFIYPWLLLLVGWAVWARWRRVLGVLVAASAAAHLTAVVLAHAGFHREAKPVRQLMAEIPPGAVVLPLLFDRDSRSVFDEYVHVFQHVAAYHAAVDGGVYLYSPDHAPLPVRPLFATDGLPALSQPWKFWWNPHTDQAEYILLSGPQAEVLAVPIMRQAFDRTIASLDSQRRFLGQEGRWGLWGPAK